MNQHIHSYIVDTSFISPLGGNTYENFEALLQDRSGICILDDDQFFPKPIQASVIHDKVIAGYKARFGTHTRFDSLLLACVDDILSKGAADYTDNETLIILSTTKGNVELLEKDPHDPRAALHYSASLIQQHLKNPNPVIVVSNACISGVSASISALRFLRSGQYRHVLVIGCDIISRFVLSGFSSFKAVSKTACRPFDSRRDGVVLGEGCGAILFSSEIRSPMMITEGMISNDANHISGPSKTGEELAFCIRETMERSGMDAKKIDFIAAHGTATEYNDEMESKAIERAGLSNVPLFSVKAHLGHTLGASGVIETIIATECLKRNMILPSKGFEIPGVSGNVNVNRQLINRELNCALKTTSGFGGCNAAMLIRKEKPSF